MPFPSPGDLPDPRIEPESPTFQEDSLPSEPPGKPKDETHGPLITGRGKKNFALFPSWFIGWSNNEIDRRQTNRTKNKFNFVHTCMLSCSAMSDSYVTPMDYSPLGSSVPGILQARIVEWVAISYSRGSHKIGDSKK